VPYRNIRTIEDLLLLREAFDSRPSELAIPAAPYPGEATLWLDMEAPVEHLFSPEGELLCAAEADAGSQGWRLSITPHGYLRFETGEGDAILRVESRVPLPSFLRDGEPFRVGVSIANASYGLRGIGYEKENVSLNRVRLYVAPRPNAELTLCGWASDFLIPDLAAAPRRLLFSDDPAPAFRGRIAGAALYNTQFIEMCAHPGLASADAVIPAIPGGGGFHARWQTDDSIEVYGRPEFGGTGSAWVYLRIADPTGRLRRVCVRSLWSGVATMNPTFFISADGDHWDRIVPERIDMRPDSVLYTVWLALSDEQAHGCYVSSAIPFLPQRRETFLEWAQSELDARVTVPGRSVEGRDIPVARIGTDHPDRFHVVLICGQHSPAETMAAHLLRPLLEKAVRLDLLSTCVFHLVPTVNVDCAHYGGNGLNANVRNANRHWFHDIQPENQAVIDYLRMLRAQGCRVGLGMDLHAGGVWRNHVLFGFAPGDLPLSEAVLAGQEAWVDRLERHAGLRRCEFARLPHGHKYAMDQVVSLFNCPALLLELSLASYFDPHRQATRVFAQEGLDIVGRGLARAIAEHQHQDH